jgi:hypothetical protein
LADVQAAFAAGISPAAAGQVLQAREHGVGWEDVTRAVAAGVAEFYGEPVRDRAMPLPKGPSVLLATLGALVIYVLFRPLLGLGHELVVAAVAWLARAVVGSMIWEPLVEWSRLDPIYVGAAIRAAGAVQVEGMAVAGPLGTALHGLVPSMFLAPDRVAAGASVSAVLAPGAPAIGRALAALGADVVWLAMGMWLFRRWRARNWLVACIGVLVQAQIAVNHLLDARVSVADLEASGLPFALALAVPGDGWFTSALAHQPSVVQAVVVASTMFLVGYGCAFLLLMLLTLAMRVAQTLRRQRSAIVVDRWPPGQRATVLVLALAIATAVSPVGVFGLGESNWQTHLAAARGTRNVTDRHSALTHAPRIAGPTSVRIEPGPNGTWLYMVDGEPEVIRGVGYNPQYAGLSRPERKQLYERDFSAMRELGINTIEGWFEGQFDAVTLDAAARNDVGIIMPFELNHDWPYDNPNVRQSILDHVSAYVERYKNHPAVRMWAPGNENLHRILYPRWVSMEGDPAARARADAFAAFLPELVDRIHALDPTHPVLYRDAEDVYLGRIRAAFDAAGGTRPWLVYGANVYSTSRMREVISAWPAQWPGRPLVISEFAPGGVASAERPIGFARDWQVIRSRPGVVLGGLAYTWATNGPEELDRVFGFVDASGAPTDGALAALSSAYLTDSAIASTVSSSE